MRQLCSAWSWYPGFSRCTFLRNDAEKLKNKCAVSIVAGFLPRPFHCCLDTLSSNLGTHLLSVAHFLLQEECILSNFFHLFCLFFQLLASDGVQQSVPVPVTITVLDANDNTPTFDNVSYSVNLFTDIIPGETVIEVHTSLEICGLTLHFIMVE